MEKGCKLSIIKEKLPKQFIDVGINEEHALVLASSLAENGKKPICFIYSSFLQRGYDEIVHDIARMNEHVIMCIDRAGFVSSMVKLIKDYLTCQCYFLFLIWLYLCHRALKKLIIF